MQTEPFLLRLFRKKKSLKLQLSVINRGAQICFKKKIMSVAWKSSRAPSFHVSITMTKSRIAIKTFEFIQPFLEGRGFFDFQTRSWWTTISSSHYLVSGTWRAINVRTKQFSNHRCFVFGIRLITSHVKRQLKTVQIMSHNLPRGLT